MWVKRVDKNQYIQTFKVFKPENCCLVNSNIL